MRCSYSCFEEARFKCQCQQAYMCETHLGKHLLTLKKHDYEHLDIDLEQSRFQNLKSETLKRIQKINEAEKLISSTTESLIKTIKKAHKEAIKRLDKLRKNSFEILKHKKFCTSELPIIEEIEKIELDIKTVEIDQIMNEIEKSHGGELGKYLEKRRVRYKQEEEIRRKEEEEERRKKEEEERRRKEEEERPERSNSYIEMSLKEKIDYYHPIVLRNNGFWDLNRLHEIGRELLVSNDGKYLFFCKLHLGI